MKKPFHKKEISPQETFIRSFLDCIAPGVVKFEVDHYIFGNTYRCVWALREYPASTESQAILRHLGEKSGVTLRIYCRQVSPGEEDRIIDNANKKNKLDGSDPNKLRQAVEAESNLRDVAELVHKMHREHEPLLHCAVYLEMTADSAEHLRQLQADVLTELVRCKLNVDKLLLRQKQGFCCVSPVGYNALGREFERVLPADSMANLYPFNYSGKTDPNGFYIGKDKYGSNIAVDFDRRDSDKTSANILILGNSGQGKSYLMKLLICNLLEAGKSVVSLDAEHVRKRDSALMMASQNLEDFDQEGVREMTKPLFAIPPHQFLFNPGSIGKRFYMDMLQLDEAEFELIRRARRGECLFKCGAERYHLEVKAPPHKAALFGTKGGK